MTVDRMPVVVLGAGPAGLAAAFRLARRGDCAVTVLERNAAVGGNAGSFTLDGMRVDYGSHRLHPSCSQRVLSDIRRLLGDDVLERRRHGRIYLRDRWVHFPLKALNLVRSLPPSFLLGIARDAVFKGRRGECRPSFATELQARLGRTICRDFYFPYAKKIWGLPPDQLDAEQARRRVSANSFGKLFRKLVGGIPGMGRTNGQVFYYPRNGFGQISEAYHDACIRRDGQVRLNTDVSSVEVASGRAVAVSAADGACTERIAAQFVISTIPVTRLVQTVTPAAPNQVLASASALRYRAMLLIYLVLDADRFSEYDAHYFPGSDVSITRLSEPKHYGLPECAGTTVLCAELPCSLEDDVWRLDDEGLKSLVLDDLARVGLPCTAPIRSVVTRRLSHAYPIYTQDFRDHFNRLDRWTSRIDGLVCVGRQGLFAHDNTHHTMEMAYAASECILPKGEFDHERWQHYRKQFEAHVVED